MTETFIKNLQESFNKEAEKIPEGGSEKPAGEKKPEEKPPPVTNTDDKGEKKPDDVSISKLIKEKYGQEMTDDQIAELFKSKEPPKEEKKPDSVPRPQPKAEDITDDEVGSFLEANGRKKEIVSRAAERAKKKDLELVKEHHLELIKQQFPDLKKEMAEQLFNERFYQEAPDVKEGEELYNDEERKLGEYLLKQEADRLRSEDKYVVDSVRNHLYQGKVKEFNDLQTAEKIDSFIAKVPKSITIDIGKSGSKDLGSYPMPLEDNTIKEVAAIMKDPALLANKFKDDKGGIDYQKLYDFLIHDAVRDNLYKSMASHFHSMGVSEIESRLNNEPDFSRNGTPKEKSKTKEMKEAEDYNAKQVAANVGKRVRR